MTTHATWISSCGTFLGSVASVGLLLYRRRQPSRWRKTPRRCRYVSSREEGKRKAWWSAPAPRLDIMVSVSTNAQGQYSFPKDRLAPATTTSHARRRYTLPPPRQRSGRPRHAARPSSRRPRRRFSRCNCPTASGSKAAGHADQKVALLSVWIATACSVRSSRRKWEEMAYTVQRMTAHSANSSPNFPFFLRRIRDLEPSANHKEGLRAYVPSINLSSAETGLQLKTQPRRPANRLKPSSRPRSA